MKIGIDTSQVAHEGTGVANLTKRLVEHLLAIDTKNEYILFFSSLRRNFKFEIFQPKADHPLDDNFQSNPKNLKIKTFKLPPVLLDLLWNKLHILPIETFIGDVDVFISSDWVQPPSRKAKMATILYDLIVYKFPEETAKKIVATQKRRLHWVKKECDVVLCISEATKRDAIDILGIPEEKLRVVYPGV